MTETRTQTIRLNQLPIPGSEPFDPLKDLPAREDILHEVHFISNEPNVKQGEIWRAMQTDTYKHIPPDKIKSQVEKLISDCLDEMREYEITSRTPVQERLKKLKEIASTITHIVDFSAPGDYGHLFKNDKFNGIAATVGADRLRADQTAILAIVIAGLKVNEKNIENGEEPEWNDEELSLFLEQPYLSFANKRLIQLREKAKQSIVKSGIKIVYTGNKDEVKVMKKVLESNNLYIPSGSVDIIPPDGIINTYDQTVKLEEYFRNQNGDTSEQLSSVHPVTGILVPANVHGIRIVRLAKKQKTIPEDCKLFVYAMPTSTANGAVAYRKGEIKGAVYNAVANLADFEAPEFTVI